jgi:hypothetical protein
MPQKKLGDGTVVKTNLQPRMVIDWYELTDAEKKEMDYIDDHCKEMSFNGFRFKGNVWDLDEFTRVHPDGMLAKAGWDGSSAQSAFHGVVISIAKDMETVVVGQVFS